MSTSPTHSRLRADGLSRAGLSRLYNPRFGQLESLCASTDGVIRPSWTTRPRRPQAGRLPARHAHACHAPSGSAAGASRVHADRLTPRVSRRLPLPQLLTLGLERGMPSRPMLRVGPAIPPPTPTPAHGTHCPPLGRSAASAFGASAFGASAFGAISVPPDFRVLCRVCIPLSTFPILLLCSARCLQRRRRRCCKLKLQRHQAPWRNIKKSAAGGGGASGSLARRHFLDQNALAG